MTNNTHIANTRFVSNVVPAPIEGDMKFRDYSRESRKTAIYPGRGEITGLLYVALGLAGEAGEIANKVKKILRDNGGVLTQEVADDLEIEGGDVLWYLDNLAVEIRSTLERMAENNNSKLAARALAGTIGGSGDER